MVHASLTLIGRDEQVEAFRQHLSQLSSGGDARNVIFLTGEAGIGKSTLLRRLRDLCGELPVPPRGVLVECSTPLAGQDIGEVEALGPWIAVIRELATTPNEATTTTALTNPAGSTDDHGKRTRRLVGELAMAWVRCIPVVGDVLESVAETATLVKRYSAQDQIHNQQEKSQQGGVYAADQTQMFQQYINLLERLSRDEPLVLMLDDFHWADTSSTNLLFAAARQLQGSPVLFVVAYRVDDAASGRSGQGHPLLHIRSELERYSMVAEIEVPRMTARDLDTLLRTRYTGYVNNDTLEEWLARVSDGNALFITQFLLTLEEDKRIDPVTGEIAEGFQDVKVPDSAQAVVRERLRRLDDDARELLLYASVEGDTFTLQVLARITEMQPLKLLSRLRQIEEKNALIHSQGKQRVYSRETTAYQFSHLLVQRALYESLGEEERELLHEAVLDVLNEELLQARQGDGDVAGIAARLAAHAGSLGRHSAAAEALLDAARASWETYAEKESLRSIDGVIESCDRALEKSSVNKATEDTLAIHAQALLLRGRIHAIHGRHDAAAADYTVAIDLLNTTAPSALLADALNYHASLLRLLGYADKAASSATRAMEIAESLQHARGISGSLRILGILAYMRRDFAAALDLYGRALAIDRETVNRRGEAGTLMNIGAVHYQNGEMEKALDHYRGSLAIAREIGDRIAEAGLYNNIGNILDRRGEHQSALDNYTQGIEIHRAIGGRSGEVLLEHNIGNVLLAMDKPDTAAQHFQKGLQIASVIGAAEAVVLNTLGYGRALVALGDGEQGRCELERAVQLAHQAGRADLEADGRALLCGEKSE